MSMGQNVMIAILYSLWGGCMYLTFRLWLRSSKFWKHMTASRRFQHAAFDALMARDVIRYDYEMQEARRELDEAEKWSR